MLTEKKTKETFKTVAGLRTKHPRKVFLGHLNVNSLRSKFDSLNELIKHNFDIFRVSEGKLDSSCLDSQFLVTCYRLVRKDRNKN